MLNRILLMGRLVRDPELRTTESGVSYCRFSLAVERDYRDRDSGDRATDFIDVVAWRGTAEFVSRYFAKGRMAVVDGRLQSHRWDDKGVTRVAWDVLAESVYFGDSKREGGAAAPAPAAPEAYAALPY